MFRDVKEINKMFYEYSLDLNCYTLCKYQFGKEYLYKKATDNYEKGFGIYRGFTDQERDYINALHKSLNYDQVSKFICKCFSDHFRVTNTKLICVNCHNEIEGYFNEDSF